MENFEYGILNLEEIPFLINNFVLNSTFHILYSIRAILSLMNLYAPLCFLFVFILGTIIGSFLNVVIYRFGSGFGLTGRSKCLSCGKTLRAFMLVPLFSYLWQRGRCAYCRTKISFQYPLVEAITGILFVAVLLVHDPARFLSSTGSVTLFLLDLLIWSTLVAITVYDLKHKIIPDRLAILFAFFAGIALLLKLRLGILPESYIPIFDTVPSWIDLAAAPLLAFPFAALWFFSGGRAMGFGDAKLAWGIGWFLGFAKGLSAIIFSFWIAFIPSIILLLLPKKSFTMKSEIPFAPYLVLGTFVVYYFGFDLLRFTF
jgi:leader peptidase (prepilin peptidase)/N-methyltransferase